MSITGNLNIRSLLAARRKSAGPGYVRFNEKEDLTKNKGFKVTRKGRPETQSWQLPNVFENILFHDESQLSTLMACLRYGPHTYTHSPKAFEDVFEPAISENISWYITTLSPDFVLHTNRKTVDEHAAKAAHENRPKKSQQTKNPITLHKVVAESGTTARVSKKPAKLSKPDQEALQISAKNAQLALDLTLLVSKVINRKNSKFYKKANPSGK